MAKSTSFFVIHMGGFILKTFKINEIIIQCMIKSQFNFPVEAGLIFPKSASKGFESIMQIDGGQITFQTNLIKLNSI